MVGTVGAGMDGGEARAKGEMSRLWTIQSNQAAEDATGGWRMMQGDWAAEDATRGGSGQRKAIGRWMTQREERGGLQGPDAAADDMTTSEVALCPLLP